MFNKTFILLSVLLLITLDIYTQPSGGPYGPVVQNYDLNTIKGKIIYVSSMGTVDGKGENPQQSITIETALSIARTGDILVVRGGIYRVGDLKFNQGITIQPYGSEQPVFKGSFEAKEWKKIGTALWKTSWDRLFPSHPDDWWSRDRYGKNTPLHLFNNDMVFIDGKLLKSVGWEGEVDKNSFYIDYESKSVYIGTDPSEHLVEITAYNRGLHRVITELNGISSDKKGFTLRGIILSQYAYCALEIDGYEPQGIAEPTTFGKDVVGSVIEHCTFSYCGRVGVYLRGDNTVLRSCNVHHTTTEGVYLLSSSDCLLEKNMFSQNNIENIDGYYPAAVKIFNQTQRTTCRDNLIFDLPLSNGIWYDVGNKDGRFINNHLVNIGTNKGNYGNFALMWPNFNGFFFEISKGAICAGNVFEDCDQGIFVLNSCDVAIYQNTFINSTVCIRRDKRSAANDHFGWHPSTGPDVNDRFGHVFVNNLMVGDQNFSVPFIVTGQHPELCEKLKDSQIKQLDYNIIVRNPNSNYKIIAKWSPSAQTNTSGCEAEIASLGELQKVFEGSSANSQYFGDSDMQVFQSRELRNYQLLSGFKEAKKASPLPASVLNLLGINNKTAPYIGAFPVK